MPGFPTMEKDQVKLRTSLVSFKEDDLEDVIADQDLMPGVIRDLREVVKAAREAQKGGRIKNAYVKVGVVKKSLVFRIKHDKGHWGEDDIVMARVYVEPERDDEIGPSKSNLLGDKGVLSTSAGKPKVTGAWWNKARKGFDDPALSVALMDYELSLRPLEEEPSLGHFLNSAEALEVVRRAIVELSKRMTVKDDKKIMVALLSAAGDERAWLESEEDDYNVRLGELHAAIKIDIQEIKGNPERNIATLQRSIERDEPYDVIARNFARVVPQMERSLDDTFEHVWKLVVQKCTEKRVSENDVELEELQGLFNRAMRDVRRLAQELDELQTLVEESEPPVDQELDLTNAPMTVKSGDLRRAWAGYLEVLEDCQRTTRILSELVRGANNLANLEGEALATAIDRQVQSMSETRLAAKAAMAKMRNTSGVYTDMKIKAGATEQLNARYFEPMTNRILTEAAKHRRSLTALRRTITPQIDRVPNEIREEIKTLVERCFADAN